ncbi:hypothetical protein Clacol_002796 [Clathrus columnatus]|uniref:RecQ-mediated genome instability protein 1 n=1 Tax=Clathrus columnatus TaxID=1419009 RepID=A0AAV5A532_9AGAM|nr:hypothetical protein Clacol_002796 [Clathrus columnatus]
MTSIPSRISAWIRQNYPKPAVNPAWLDACLIWLGEELNLTDIQTQGDEIIKNVEIQLLNSDLHDSMIEGTGFPRDINTAENTRLYGKLLVQITSITEIGHSAFNLQNIHQTRIDRVDLTGLVGDDNTEDDDEGPIPKFPRSMLKFEISDGTHSIRAIEFRRLPALELGVTPLGYKAQSQTKESWQIPESDSFMIIKDVPIRRGIAFLEPSNVELKGYMTEELEVHRDAQFKRHLAQRLGRPEVENDGLVGNPSTLSNTGQGGSSTLVNTSREPLRDLDLHDVQSHSVLSTHLTEQEHEPPTRRRVPASGQRNNLPSHQFPFTNSSTLSILPSPPPTTTTTNAPLRQPSGQGGDKITVEEDVSEFGGDDTSLDGEFLQELDRVEQAAMAHGQPHPEETLETSLQSNTTSEIIFIDSDSDDKENVAPITSRRVRRRIFPPDDDVIVID